MILVRVATGGRQPTYAVLYRPHDLAAGRTEAAALLAVQRRGELGGQNDVLAPVAEDLSQCPLRAAIGSVGVGGIEQGDAGVEGDMHHLACAVEVERLDHAAEVVAAQTDHRNLQAGSSQHAVFHVDLLPYRTADKAI